ncbi:unnamed protein product [Ilex paraguariensis]|uniref:Ion transport domain-containing protein n=1 Tax=Ilex paraguariensis TaxID=185542 RepID=A0ABC8R715_9AQUA
MMLINEIDHSDAMSSSYTLYLIVLGEKLGSLEGTGADKLWPWELRECVVILAGMLGTYINVLALWLLFLLFSSWLGYVIFEDTQQGKTIFTSYGSTIYQMFVLFTTSNNPDVWIPAYKFIYMAAEPCSFCWALVRAAVFVVGLY